MTNINDINIVKNSISDFITSHKNIIKALPNDLHGNYDINWNESLEKNIQRLCDEMNLFRQALSKKDRTTQIAALVVARTRALDLQNFFIDIFEDIDNLTRSDEYEWPTIPENYQIPKHYK